MLDRNRSVLALSLVLCSASARSGAAPLPAVKDEGMTNPVHAAHVGEIVASRKVIDRAAPDTSGFSTSFTLNDQIYLRAYAKESIANAFLRNGVKCINEVRRTLVVVVDGKPSARPSDDIVSYDDYSVSGQSFLAHTSFSFEADGKRALNGPATGHRASEMEARFSTRILPQLTAGEHKLHLETRLACYGERTVGGFDQVELPEPQAVADLTITVKAGEAERALKKNGPSLPPPGLKDKALEQGAMAAVKREYSADTVLKVVISGKSWNVTTNRVTGVPIERTIDGVTVVKQVGHSDCTLVGIGLNETYAGSGKWNAPRVLIGNSNPFPCANAQ